jgi:L-cysteine/cystine lyase
MVVDTATEAKVELLRSQLPAVLITGYFNTGSYGPLPVVAQRAANAVAEQELTMGRISPGAYEANRDRNRSVASLAAEIFNADADEIALTHSASEGLNIALSGITWHEGDEVITTVEEHPALLLPLALLAHRYGVVTRYANIGDSGRGVCESISDLITARTRVIALSHVLWSTGAVLPLRDVVDVARRHGLMVIVDGAQSAGQVAVDLHALGIDAYAMAGQKWLCGPEGSGLLFLRRDRFADIAPTYVRYGQFEPGGYFMPERGAMRYEIGEFYAPVVAAQEASLGWLRDEIDFEWALSRIACLAAEFRRKLSEVDGVSIVTPEHAMGGLVNFNLDGWHPRAISETLYDRGFTIRYVDAQPCVVSARASIGWWNTEQEITDLANTVADLATNGSDPNS